ncbi:16S rRNA (cytidine(1402)-2'-O)-methyltransferase [Candidatus Peregrinibacteria bacterium RIFOXYC2_FULL_33_13]|nr:MAG: Ribosomal RNA small subunit methyltransferase I [Candidatus Peregrinibacteria bacterium GW2011_GWA2_33_10]KKP41270.1 MAG: 16S rRNA methyltransferase [Candidatus Peregrinibacteria bacterium GW2011_GWC2_33_13]OGJ48976.1 MAG: 16S rRNA (cytidine(1402)-2'-O)-methyltransferase [Candidatus Peregrinibacteria bacterium RIFOXYA2_FULL_33_7]OGJ54487.1 MAG: 16S rRNA (cytidine(1402)-2'-O)-methyltransferase [Candidatus Peregrinibacteria bacterium RIFOXYC2_FULL_33_13]
MLYIVSTPIGNLKDISLRALDVLKSVDLIVAEDTRHSGKLLKEYDIKTPLNSFHSHSSRGKLDFIIKLLEEGKNVALISDAGTPGVSDPGYPLIQEAILKNISISAVPGASAAIAALTLSGFPMHRFLFLGFLPLKKGRQTLIKSFKEQDFTIIFFESPHRIYKTLKQIYEISGDFQAAVCREMTKMHEEVIRGKISDLINLFEKNKPKGEFVVVLKREL